MTRVAICWCQWQRSSDQASSAELVMRPDFGIPKTTSPDPGAWRGSSPGTEYIATLLTSSSFQTSPVLATRTDFFFFLLWLSNPVYTYYVSFSSLPPHRWHPPASFPVRRLSGSWAIAHASSRRRLPCTGLLHDLMSVFLVLLSTELIFIPGHTQQQHSRPVTLPLHPDYARPITNTGRIYDVAAPLRGLGGNCGDFTGSEIEP